MRTWAIQVLVIVILTMMAYFAAPSVKAQGGPEILVADLKGPVTPVMLSFIERAIEDADLRDAEALILRLDTPGGEVNLTRRIIQAIVASDVPVVVYVWPPGGGALSAGTFITLAAHADAMAPNTTIGAASPISGNGGEIDNTLRSKIENVLLADMRNLAQRRGDKAAEWVEGAIIDAKAATAPEALELGIIDFVAKDVDELVDQLDGFTVEVNGEMVTLETGDAQVSFIEQTSLEWILGIITNPNIALLLISVGSMAILYEIINPGGYMSGIVGAILLLLGLYAVGQLPINFAGLALLLLAFVLFGAELFTPTHGALTAGGIAAFILGGLLLFNTSEFAYEVPLTSIIGIPLTIGVFVVFGLTKVVQSRRLQPTTGREGMIGAKGTVKLALEPTGSVLVWGERWEATSADGLSIEAGEQIEVTEMDGLRLKVRKAN